LQFVDLLLEAASPHFRLNHHPVRQENDKKHLAHSPILEASTVPSESFGVELIALSSAWRAFCRSRLAFRTPSLMSFASRSIVFFAGVGNFIPAESWSSQCNSWRFSLARFREDLDASSSSSTR
jgi:hypothetical protein